MHIDNDSRIDGVGLNASIDPDNVQDNIMFSVKGFFIAVIQSSAVTLYHTNVISLYQKFT